MILPSVESAETPSSWKALVMSWRALDQSMVAALAFASFGVTDSNCCPTCKDMAGWVLTEVVR